MQTSRSRALPATPGRALPRCRAAIAVLGGLLLSQGCDAGRAQSSATDSAVAVPQTDIASRPDMLFQVFGERDDPRMIPVAVIRNGRLEGITLDDAGWRRLDSLYLRSPARVSLYHDGRFAGQATVRQGMWEKEGEPLYALPSCGVLTPLAAVKLGTDVKASYTVEFLASTASLGRTKGGPRMAPDVASRAAREVAYGVGERASLTPSSLDSLDFRAVAIHTGATAEPTLVASFINPGASEADQGMARHVFAIADRSGDRYAATFTHAVNAPAGTAAYRRYVDHLDLTGDGVDEIVLEGWEAGGDTYLMVLSFAEGRWGEAFRGNGTWCVEKSR